jgi:dolichol kinase
MGLGLPPLFQLEPPLTGGGTIRGIFITGGFIARCKTFSTAYAAMSEFFFSLGDSRAGM